MEALVLNVKKAAPRVKETREAGMIPLNYYGKGVKNLSFAIPYQEFRRAYMKGGKSTIMTLVTDDKKEFPALIHEMQIDPVTDLVIHVDVKAVDMNKPITTEIPLTFVGTAPAVKELQGIFVHQKESIKVSCLPKDLVHEIEVDVSSLINFHVVITIGDIALPKGIKSVDDLKLAVAKCVPPKEEEAVATTVVAPSEIPTTVQKAAEPAAADAAAGKAPAAKAPAAEKKADKK